MAAAGGRGAGVLVSMLLQLVGAAAVLVGGTWAMGPWFLLAAGVVLLVVPELLDHPARERDVDGDEVASRRKGREAS